MGKSAQIPLQTWLPDAMAGPTPISALIHAATMVAAGVYVVARLYPVFLVTPAALWILAIAAALTAVAAALSAFAQRDLKRILAYSTVSQLALMVAALAAGGRDAAVFHLMSHGGFKALLFLGAGVIIHKAGTGDVDELATHNLRRKLPVTFVTMTIGLAALAGCPALLRVLLQGVHRRSGLRHRDAQRPDQVAPGYHASVGHRLARPGRHPPDRLPHRRLRPAHLVDALRPAGARLVPLGRGVLAAPAEGSGAATGAEAATRSRPPPRSPRPANGPWKRSRRIHPRGDRGRGTATAKERTGPEAPRAELLPLVVLAAITTVFGFVGLNVGWFAGVARRRRRQRLPRLGGRRRQAHPARRRLPPGPALLSTVLALIALALGAGLVLAAARAKPGHRPEPRPRLPAQARLPRLPRRRPPGRDRRPAGPGRRGRRRVPRHRSRGRLRAGQRAAARLLGEGLRRVQTGNVQLYLTGVLTGVVVIAAALGFGR